eukprot:TRINITY_DN66442_c2_g4_i1.p1 TRINITY_DN66442_c2_g4~~TRINITY_DN66442_c2_g4_i1.p1  ORF type:complete len:158 (+),score=5.86 TRINITY_DN66442_c2_g4_i1:44-517(+)
MVAFGLPAIGLPPPKPVRCSFAPLVRRPQHTALSQLPVCPSIVSTVLEFFHPEGWLKMLTARVQIRTHFPSLIHSCIVAALHTPTDYQAETVQKSYAPPNIIASISSGLRGVREKLRQLAAGPASFVAGCVVCAVFVGLTIAVAAAASCCACLRILP